MQSGPGSAPAAGTAAPGEVQSGSPWTQDLGSKFWFQSSIAAASLSLGVQTRVLVQLLSQPEGQHVGVQFKDMSRDSMSRKLARCDSVNVEQDPGSSTCIKVGSCCG